MKKMKMTQCHANALMDDLALLFLCSKGIPEDENGEITLTDEMREGCETFARATFNKICDELAKKEGEPWVVIPCEEE